MCKLLPAPILVLSVRSIDSVKCPCEMGVRLCLCHYRTFFDSDRFCLNPLLQQVSGPATLGL
jgi:hypothetical protein